jgi:hypothetical protein
MAILDHFDGLMLDELLPDLGFHPTAFISVGVPQTYNQAMASGEAAVELELSAMIDLEVWEVVPIPIGRRLLGTIWVFRKKLDEDGAVSKFKARLCAQGSLQAAEDILHTYAPTGRFAALRAAIVVGLSKGHTIHQMDAKNAFLNGELEEEVYLRAPAGLSVPTGHCLRLKKAIYGLRQAPRVWYAALSRFFASINFESSPADPCLFISKTIGWECFVHVYVDDMVIISPDVQRFKDLISARFKMDDIGELKHLLGVKVSRVDDKQLYLSQEVYLAKVLEDHNLSNARPVSVPMVPNTQLARATPFERQQFEQVGANYRRSIGMLMYLAVCTRPDIAFALSQLSKHLESPGITHWRAVIHLLRYLSGTRNHGILLDGRSPTYEMRVFSDADWANDKGDCRSYSGYIATLNNSVISWRSRKQPVVAVSTTEAEYISLFEAAQEAKWLLTLLDSLGITLAGKLILMVDNQSAIALANNPMFQQRTKHIPIKYHWIREFISEGTAETRYVPTNDQLADFLTKALRKKKHVDSIIKLNINRF